LRLAADVPGCRVVILEAMDFSRQRPVFGFKALVFGFELSEPHTDLRKGGLKLGFGEARRNVLLAIPVKSLKVKQKSALRFGFVAGQHKLLGDYGIRSKIRPLY
jgi:hypothetical protein